MLETVTSFLIQKKGCVLPCIGEFKITTRSAEYDAAKKLMLPPIDEIVFNYSEESMITPELVKYVARKRSIDVETAELYLKNYCEEWRNAIAKGGEIRFQSFGTLQKNAVGNIYFKPDRQPDYRRPIRVERLDDSTLTATEQPQRSIDADPEEMLAPDRAGNRWWKIWALILLVIAIAAIAFHFYRTGWSGFKTGSQNKVSMDSTNMKQLSRDVTK
jgi:nucleoid DNA-binding protein